MKLTVAAMLLVCAAILINSGGGAAVADTIPGAFSACDNSTGTLKATMAACQAYVVGPAPMPMWGSGAQACCTALKNTSLPCLCSRSSSLSPYLLQLINLPAVKNVMQTCGLQVPSGFTCGGVKLGN